MSTKRPRSPSTSGDEGAPSSKRVASSTDDGDQEPAAEEAPVSPSQETSQVESSATQPDAEVALPNAQEQHTPPPGMMVLAPAIEAVHHSWEAFEDALKAYSKATYQLYVIRSTTSVKRRNLKISETANSSRASGDRTEAAEASETVEKTLIPEKFQWYSKSLKCTHGWKDRHRGTGKRGSGVVRSTSCPAKMCVTLQHRGAGPEDWQVVVTKHIYSQLEQKLLLQEGWKAQFLT
ncbi:hypothetical protein PHYBOEH_009861 [Phytophthora boehmeriae]|uniref:Uncharacterized protein n=1 Tax=Phytophthora boehmeriae TaxID=109152 RepID=A0A8T1VQN7_9STRA|nr:hypothetical protein PHYBOEH_009861 [Phytophthora boehmeriae]